MVNYEIDKVLVASTAHITKECSEFLSKGIVGNIVIDWDYGWFIWVDTEDMYSDAMIAFPALINLMETATAKGCSWLRLDCDGPIYENLPTYEW
jgi:hypothetical protein